MKHIHRIMIVFILTVLAIALTGYVMARATPNPQIFDPSIYLPIVIKQEPPSPTPTPTFILTPTHTPTPTSTPTSPPASNTYYLWPGGLLEADSYPSLATYTQICYTSDCLNRWTASLAGDMVGSTYWITGTLTVGTSNAYRIYFRFLLAHSGVETPLVTYYSDLTPGTWSFTFQPLDGPDPQTVPGDVLIFEIDRRNNQGSTRLEVTYGGSNGVRLTAPAAPLSPPASFTRGYVAYSASAPYALDVARLDADQDNDVVYLSQSGQSLSWGENDGNQNFSWHTIASGLNLPIDNASVQIVDVDRDGDADVVAPTDWITTFAWWENNGAQSFTRHDLTCSLCYPKVVHAADIDGDTDIDFAVAGSGLSWWENDEAQNFTRHSVTSTGLYSWVYPVDLDRDSDTDLLAALATGTLEWWENDGSQNFTRHYVRNTSNATTGNRTTLRPVDFDGDGDLDLLSASDILDELAWWENDGAQYFTRHPLTAGFNRPLDLIAASLDNDNDLDLVAAGPAFAWYEETTADDFLRHLFVRESASAIDMIDLDGDGDLDIVNGDRNDSRIYWWENPKLP